MYTSPHAKYQFFLSDFKETRFLSTDFRKLLKFHENPVRAELFHMVGWTDTKKLTVAFRDFSNTPKMHFIYQGYIMFHPQTAYWRPSLANTFLSTDASTTISFPTQQFFLIRLHTKTPQKL